MEAIMKRFTTLMSIFLAGIIGASCVTAVGPEGPPGRDGLDGQVEIYSETIIIDSDVDFGVQDEYVSVASYGWNILDESTVDYGIVLAYLRFDGTTNWHALPFSTPYENDIVVLRYSFDIDNFDLIIEGEVADNNELNESLFDGDVLRVVAIPPDMVYKGKGIDYTNYEQVKQIYGLED